MSKFTLAVCVMALCLISCTAEVDSRIGNAIKIVKKNMESSPATFSLISGDVLWTGTNNEGAPSYIVRLEYDAQNKFGALIRSCEWIAYTENGDKIGWNVLFGVSECNNQETFEEKEETIKSMVASNFKN